VKKTTEYEQFESLADRLLGVPHNKVKQQLEAEKHAKKRKKSKVSSASREADGKV
jgi:hypothetical protein